MTNKQASKQTNSNSHKQPGNTVTNAQHRFPKSRHQARKGGCRKNKTMVADKPDISGENISHTHAVVPTSFECTVALFLVFLKAGQYTEPNPRVQGPGSGSSTLAFTHKKPRSFSGQGAQSRPCQGR